MDYKQFQLQRIGQGMKTCRNSLMKKIKILLLSFDMFGQQVNFTVKKQEKYASIVGAIFGCAIIVFCLYTFSTMFIEMSQGQNPNVISDIEFTKSPKLIELTNETFTLGVTIVDQFSQTITQRVNQTIFVPLFYICHRNLEESKGYVTKCNASLMKPCSLVNNSLFSVIYICHYQTKQIDDTGLGKQIAYCIDDKVWNNKVELQGFSSSPTFKILMIEVKKCKNNTYPGIGNIKQNLNKQQVCASSEIIHEKLKEGYFGVKFSDRMIQQKQLGNPYKMYGKTLTTSFSSNTYTQIQAYFRHSYSKTIENFYYYFGEKQYINHELQFEKQEQYQQPLVQQSSDFIRFSIQLDDKKITYYRTYNNVLNIFGDIGGLLSLIMFIVNLIIGPIQKVQLDLFLANQFFSFQQKNKDTSIISAIKDSKDQKQSQIVPQDQTFTENRQTYIKAHSTIFQRIINKEEQINANLNGLKQIFKLKINQENFGIMNYFCLNDGKQREIINQNIQQIYDKIDIIYLIRKIMEIDKLKLLLLSNDQIKLFEYVPKPIVKLNKEPEKIQQLNNDPKNLNQNQQFIDKIQESYAAYKNIRSASKNYLDKKLLAMMDPNLKALFDETISQESPNRISNSLSRRSINNKIQSIEQKDDPVIDLEKSD